MSESIAIVQALLTPNLRRDLPFMIMLLMLQGIHPEIIFNLIPYVPISRQQHEAIMMAWTLLRTFSSILPPVRGVKSDSFRKRRIEFRRESPVSTVFIIFQNSLIRKMLEKCGFLGMFPSFETVQTLVQNLANVRTSHLPMFPIGQLFLAPNSDLVLLKTALEIKRMITHVRSSYPEILSFLSHNENAMKNIIMVWRKQVIVKQIVYGTLFDILEPAKINSMFIFCILAAIDPDFIDKNLDLFIQNCGDQNKTLHFSYNFKHLAFLNCETVEPKNLEHGDIGKVIELFSSMLSSMTKSFQVIYALRQWSMAFGRIVPCDRPEFEEVTFDQGSWVPIFDVFSRLWEVFFRNFARTFEVSFLPFGNIQWSEQYTRLCSTNFDWIIRIVVENFAFRIGAKDNHDLLKSKFSWMLDSRISDVSYGRLIFLDGIRNCRISGQICSCFLRDFWLAHRKPDPNMSDIDYLRWLFSIPGTFAVFGKSWIELVNAIQNGKELPKIMDGSSGDFTYLSFPTDPTDPEVQQEYDENFIQLLGRNPEISDFSMNPIIRRS